MLSSVLASLGIITVYCRKIRHNALEGVGKVWEVRGSNLYIFYSESLLSYYICICSSLILL